MSCLQENDMIRYTGPERPDLMSGATGIVVADYTHSGFVQCDFGGFEYSIEAQYIQKTEA